MLHRQASRRRVQGPWPFYKIIVGESGGISQRSSDAGRSKLSEQFSLFVGKIPGDLDVKPDV
jgi:hypothetical protein